MANIKLMMNIIKGVIPVCCIRVGKESPHYKDSDDINGPLQYQSETLCHVCMGVFWNPVCFQRSSSKCKHVWSQRCMQINSPMGQRKHKKSFSTESYVANTTMEPPKRVHHSEVVCFKRLTIFMAIALGGFGERLFAR